MSKEKSKSERKNDVCVIEYPEESFYVFTLKTRVGLGGFKRIRKLKKMRHLKCQQL